MILGGGGIWVGATASATALTGLVANFVFPFSGILSVAAIAAAIVAVVIVAVTIAVVQGIDVISATELPGQLAELITDARTNAPDVASLADTDKGGATTLFSIFVGATLPAPATGDLTCHNSGVIRGELVKDPNVIQIGMPPCLNPTGIPEPVWSDPQFLVQELVRIVPGVGPHLTPGTVSPTISWKDGASEASTTGRLHNNWFITTDRRDDRADVGDRLHRLERRAPEGLPAGGPDPRPCVRQPRRLERHRLGPRHLPRRRHLLRERIAAVPEPRRQEAVGHGATVAAGDGGAEFRPHAR